MVQKDLNEKILVGYNDVFADVVNVLIFGGEQRIKEKELANSLVHSQYRADDNTIHEEEKDVSKLWTKYNVKLALYGIENQNRVVKRMPLRVFGYEGASYREQLDEEKLYPVITLVLYFGTKSRWNAKKNLKGIIDTPDYLDEYVNDVKINVCEVAWLDAEIINKFTSDFKIIANFFACKRENSDYIPKDKTRIKHVDAVLKLLSTMTGDNRYEEILANGEGEIKNMCEVADRLENRGLMRGLKEGRMEGRKDTLIELAKKKLIQIEDAAREAGMTMEDFEALISES